MKFQHDHQVGQLKQEGTIKDTSREVLYRDAYGLASKEVMKRVGRKH